jgi:hypothetical protein
MYKHVFPQKIIATNHKESSTILATWLKINPFSQSHDLQTTILVHENGIKFLLFPLKFFHLPMAMQVSSRICQAGTERGSGSRAGEGFP